ncbi:MAG: hypothetical protein COZ49_03685 [Candidatus Yonathbacteria bacterium CG_4_10_14_3_um_filter_47_65]|uniref:Trigger factor n=2 Tax=Parcubacteria group TaxID=1794811 RepID=A0A2M8D7R3_9BACT|nr:MAG: hypothetical protein AUJ44_00490 [Candidatus Nomurabacteria bacterium CG1_02_47_685]PIP04251.1 MAG: hypothetical protein COX54_00185 [Candidatus Yonathbacteria bacterium CG23_combo_of_CG06-09_8_20_14_all_46_18]PIQ31952.1 MAG: hypothetical protein COW61_02850 [Candidatus Yonathbacteria bacterium CG17_big_fil_post_rev_8_21_14_2_50_46_19]PIX56160.1 MAG: hypothetical protein COZ49_03685 [Candidatus Yonathbacteria bacterium CG_4_10_14_3_um_filter_47_65]PIY58004.1 MAG: hypothetical protein CO
MLETQTEIKKLERSEIEIAGAISAEELEQYRKKAELKLSENLTIPGFRKGHIPEAILLQKVGSQAVLEKMAEDALAQWYPKFIAENKLDAIGRPEVTITKLAEGNPFEFKIQVAVMPEVMLGDYKKTSATILSKKTLPTNVSKKEVDDVLVELRKARQAKILADKDDGDKSDKSEKPAIPELDDAFAQSLGNFKDVADLTEKITENLKQEKARKTREKQRMEIIEKIAADVKTDIPNIIVESEIERMIAEFKNNITSAGGTFEEYLRHIKKTEEDVRKELRPTALKRSRIQLALNKIALVENITPNEETLKKEIDRILDHYKDADPERARIYVETVLINEKVFEFLEEQKSQ